MTKLQKILLIGTFSIVVLGLGAILIFRKSKKKNVDITKNYIIGDSQSPYIDNASQKAKRISEKSGKSSLWEGGQNLKWLKSAVEQYSNSPDVNSIIINIGTNGGFNPNDDVSGLIKVVKDKFPNADLYAVQGSWGWGGNKNVTTEKVKTYYDKFRNLGVKVIDTAIGSVNDPHGNLPIYQKIGEELDNIII